MWPFSKFNPERARRLRGVLEQTKKLVDASPASGWTNFTPVNISKDLAVALSRMERREKTDSARLKMLFAPTGPIQETAIDAGWGEEYLALSTEFDALITEA